MPVTDFWEIISIGEITPEAFFMLIGKNRERLRKTFPVTIRSCESLEMTADFLISAKEKAVKKEGHYFYISHTETKNLIGYVCIKNIDYKIRKCEFAYFIDAAFEGRGIISKAISGIIAYCFNALGMNKIFICTSKENMASQRIATKHGFVKEGLLREEFLSGDGNLEDIFYFGLLKSDYYERPVL